MENAAVIFYCRRKPVGLNQVRVGGCLDLFCSRFFHLERNQPDSWAPLMLETSLLLIAHMAGGFGKCHSEWLSVC